MKTSDDALEWITYNEDPKLKPSWDGRYHARWDDVGKCWDIAWGLRFDADGSPVIKGTAWTPHHALNAFKVYISNTEKKISNFIERNKIQLSQHEFDALVDFDYNTGGFVPSNGICKVLLAGKKDQVSFQMCRWIWKKSNGEKLFVQGLANRRYKECFLFDKGIYAKEVPEIKRTDEDYYMSCVQKVEYWLEQEK